LLQLIRQVRLRTNFRRQVQELLRLNAFSTTDLQESGRIDDAVLLEMIEVSD
jgi:hypothetical protein